MSCGREPMTSQRAGVWSSRACRATLPFEGLIYARSAVTLAPTFFVGAAACRSVTMPLVGGLGLRGELPLGLAHPLVGDPDAGWLALAAGAPAVISSRRSFLSVSDGCWWA